jgi:CMP-N,N'-diacetyllegionaminic acid synthase
MISDKKVIAIIPARGGSKGLPGKNIKPLCGKPLIAWSIERALESKYIDEVLVSTDSEEIARIALAHGAKVPFLRPADLATDTAGSVDTVLHALDFYRDNLAQAFDYVVLLEPTSPLREPGDLDAMLELLDRQHTYFDAVVSVGEVHEHPSIMKRREGNTMVPFYEAIASTKRRQDNIPAYFPYGVGYLAKQDVLRNERSFYPQRTGFHQIKRYQCYEIDDVYDFIAIEAVMAYEWGRESKS